MKRLSTQQLLNSLFLRNGDSNKYFWSFLLQTYYFGHLQHIYSREFDEEDVRRVIMNDSFKALKIIDAILSKKDYDEELCVKVSEELFNQMDKNEKSGLSDEELLVLNVLYDDSLLIVNFPCSAIDDDTDDDDDGTIRIVEVG